MEPNKPCNLTCRLAMLATLLLLAGCKTDPAPAPVLPTIDPRDRLTPRQTVQSFRDVLRGEEINTALFMLDDVNYESPSAGIYRTRLKKLSEDMTRGGYDFSALEEKVDQDCALVIVKESGPRSNGFNVLYLLRRGEGWKISPELWSFEKFLGMDTAQLARFKGLERWYQLRRGELRGSNP